MSEEGIERRLTTILAADVVSKLEMLRGEGFTGTIVSEALKRIDGK